MTLYITPGHTPGTLSALIPVRDNGTRHLAALWGGTGLNADRASLEAYIRSAQRFDDIAQKAGADIILSNHTDWDGSKVNLPRLAKRAPDSPNPYVVGTPAVRRYLEVAERMCDGPPDAAELIEGPRVILGRPERGRHVPHALGRRHRQTTDRVSD